CGSVDVTVVDGTIQIAFVGTYGTELETSLNEGNSIMFEPETSTITVPSTNVDDVVVVVDGQQYTLAPGETESLATPEARLSRLKQFIMDEVTDGNIDPELEVSLLAKADAALSALEKDNPNAAKVAMNDLKALTNHVEAQIDKKITPEVAAEIIEQANAIIEPLGG
ncbi:MAG: FIMAH domain-containing protein, partial [Planctomycetota bacterium]